MVGDRGARHPSPPVLLLIGCLIAATLVMPPALAAPVTLESIGVQRLATDQTEGLAEDQRKLALARLDEARSLVEEANTYDARSKALRTLISEAPARIADLQQNAAVQELKLSIADIEQWTLPQLELVLSERQKTLAELRNELVEKDRKLSADLTLARTGSGELTTLEARLAEETKTASNANGDNDANVVERLWQGAREQMLKARIGWLRLQQDNLHQLTELAQLERDLAATRVEMLTTHVGQLRDYVQRRREAEAETARQVAQAAVAEVPSAIKTLQQKISALTAEQADLVRRESNLDRESERIKAVSEELKRDYERMQQIAELGGSSAQVSTLLQKRRAVAPSPKSLAQRAIEYQQQLSDAALRQLEIDELLRDTRDIDAQVDALLGDVQAADPAARDALYPSAREALVRHRDTALDLWKGYTRYIGKLSALEANSRQLMQDARTYREFIDDRLLWMPSNKLIPLNELGQLFAGIGWLISPDNVAQLLHDTLQVVVRRTPAFALWVVVLAGLIAFRGRAKRLLANTAAATQKVRTDSIAGTLQAIGATLVLILLLPWLFTGAGLLLGRLPTAHEYTTLVGVGLQSVGQTLLFLGTLRHLCRTDGLARAHLLWNPALCDHLRNQAIWLMPLAAPLAFLATTGAAAVPSAFIQLPGGVITGQEPGLPSIGRLAVVVLMVLLTLAIFRIWRKNGPVIQAMARQPDHAKWANYHVLWFTPSIMLPLGLAVAALGGYYYTTTFLAAKVGETLWFVIILVLLKDLLMRGLYVTQRRLRFQEALRYREEALARAAADGRQSDAEAGELPIEEDKINYGQLGIQARELVHLGYMIGLLAGLWWIWKDVIPAFSFLDKIELPISTTKLVDGVDKEVPLTLGDMGAGLLLGGLALFAARNVPALLELTLLQRLPLSRASRYAVTTLTQYVVAMAGLVITFNALGLQWSSIQWLVAALSVGLGFGLQEIVANFISGIILLFEQPIRVGDVVTVDNTTGTVSRIRIRATTIVNWERQELVIPNKSFITGQLINWTLSDTVNRLTITVGVGYATDTRKAMEIMKEVATAHPKVLTDPPPRISFEGFGDNALTLIMRAYLNDIDVRLATITELHQTILDRFREAGIEIAFPQRDVHLDTNRPLELVLRREAPR